MMSATYYTCHRCDVRGIGERCWFCHRTDRLGIQAGEHATSPHIYRESIRAIHPWGPIVPSPTVLDA